MTSATAQKGKVKAMETKTVRYRIETRNSYGIWTAEEVGDPSANYFESEAEAEAAIESLRALGDEWATAEYRVVRS